MLILSWRCYAGLMPRIPRGQMAGYAYHVINRGNGRAQVFHKDEDYGAFLKLIESAKARHYVSILAFCLMPNHFHLVLEPSTQVAMSKFMHWLLTSHVRRYHRHYDSSGHVWQGRFKSFPIQRDEHLMTVIRYVLQNPVRSGLVASPKDWTWLSIRRTGLTDPLPEVIQEGWNAGISIPLAGTDLKEIREAVNRQRPYGDFDWQIDIAGRLGLESTMRNRGRPRSVMEK